MLNKLKELREDHENGFTLIELLVVILIIGILASIAIPVFLNQRKTANDGAVESDVKNAATQVESWIVNQKGGNPDVVVGGLTGITDIKKSSGVSLAIKGNANSYCIVGTHENGKKYVGTAANITNPNRNSSLTYANDMGGLDKGASASAWLGGCTSGNSWIVIT